MNQPATVAIIGAGNRGRDCYGQYIREHPEQIQAVAVAEPEEERRSLFADEHDIPSRNQFTDWNELLQRDRLADGLIISTLDTMHVEPALKAMDKGYKLLLEKPISTNLDGIRKVYRKYRDTNATVLVAHVLRYTRFFQKLKELLEQNVIGNVRFVDLVEHIGYFHFAHSYVRGNWRNTDVAAPIILAKSCHDLDILHWLLGTRTKVLSSRASREVFRKENQPEEAADRCLDCDIEPDCPYSARKIYLQDIDGTEWPASVISNDHSYNGRLDALRNGPYGRCVWDCDNNIPEVQRVCMTQEDNTEVTFSLTAFSRKINRTLRLSGSEGEIEADLEEGRIELFQFGQNKQTIDLQENEGLHSGGDTGLMEHFVDVLNDGGSDREWATTLERSIESHLMAFAAEASREHNEIIELEPWRKKHISFSQGSTP